MSPYFEVDFELFYFCDYELNQTMYGHLNGIDYGIRFSSHGVFLVIFKF